MSIYFSNSAYVSCIVGRTMDRKHVSAKGNWFCPSANLTSKELLRAGRLFVAVQKQQRSVMEGLPINNNKHCLDQMYGIYIYIYILYHVHVLFFSKSPRRV